MKVLKRIISILLVVVLMITTFSACSSFNLKSMDNILTKGEWIENVCNYFGLEQTTNSDSFFKDVTVNDEIYPFVQAAAKWGVIDTSGNFEADEKITKEYACATAVRAIGSEVTGLDKNTSDTEAAKYAAKVGIAESSSWSYMHKGITQSEAEILLNNAAGVYTQRQFEEYDNSEYKNEVKRESDTQAYRIDSTQNEVIVDTDKNQYAKGDIIVFGEGIDQKSLVVTEVRTEGNKTVLETRDAEISEIFESIDMSGTGTVENASDVQTADGVQLVSFNGQSLVSAYETPNTEVLGISNDTDTINVGKHEVSGEHNASDLEFKVEYQKGKVTSSIKSGAFTGSVENKLDENGNEIPADQLSKWESEDGKQSDEIKGGYKITGSIKLDDILVSAKLKYNTTNVFGYDTGLVNLFDPADSFDVNIDAQITSKLTLEGYLSETIKVATIPIQAGPVTIKIQVKVYAKANGSLGVKVVYYNSTSVTWQNDIGFKKTSHTDTEKDFEIQIKFELGAKLEIGIGACGIDIIDVDFSIGLELKIKFEMNDLVLADEGLYKHGGDEQYLTNAKDVYLLCFDATLTLPIIKIGINTGDSLLGKLSKKLSNVKLSVEWEIVGGDKALVKGLEANMHYELNSGFVDSCKKDSLTQYEKEDEEETTDTGEEDENNNRKGYLETDKYALEITAGKSGTLNITSIPKDCTISDIVVQSSDSSVATVGNIQDNGGSAIVTVNGVEDGVATITVSCTKTNESLSCTVIVVGE